MKSFYQEWTDYNEEKYGVKYHFEGSYWPGNYLEPPEFPELVIDEFYKLSDCKDIEDVPDEVYAYINEHRDGDE